MFDMELPRIPGVVCDEPDGVVRLHDPPIQRDVLAGLDLTEPASEFDDLVVGEFLQDMLEDAVPDGHVAEFVFQPVPFRVLTQLAVRQAVKADALFRRSIAGDVHDWITHPPGNTAVLLEY